MLNTLTRLATTLILIGLLAGCGSTASTTTDSQVVELDITVYHPSAPPQRYSISCDGDSGTVDGTGLIDATSACAQLFEPDTVARLVDGPQHDVCTEQYGGPDEADLSGFYDGPDGLEVETFVHRANGCGIHDWEALLDAVLPEPAELTEEFQ